MRRAWVLIAVAACGRGDDVTRCADCVAPSIPPPELAAIEMLPDGAGRVVVLDADGSHLRALVPAAPTPLAEPHANAPMWSADGRYLAYPSDFGESSIIELRRDGNFGGGRRLGRVMPRCALPDGRFVAVAETGCVGNHFECAPTYDARVIDPDTTSAVVLGGVVDAGAVACSRAGSIAWVTGEGIVVARTSGRTTYPALFDGRGPQFLAWSDDERHLAWSDATVTAVLDVQTGSQIRVASSRCDSLEVSHDFVSGVCDGKLRRFSLDGVEVAGAAVEASSAHHSRDGALAYATQSALYVVARGSATAIAHGRFADPAWRSAEPLAPRATYPAAAEHAAPADGSDVDIRVVVGLGRSDARVDGTAGDALAATIRPQLELFRACYRPRAAAIPGLAVASRVVFAPDNAGTLGPISVQTFVGYDDALATCVLAAAGRLKLGAAPPHFFAIDLTFGHPGAPGAVSPKPPPPPAEPPLVAMPLAPPEVVKVSIDSIDVTGAIDGAAVGRVIRARAGIFRACYQKELNKKPTIAGTLAIVAAVADDGTVTHTTRVGGTLRDDAVIACVSSNVMRLRFPAIRAGTVRLALTFTHEPHAAITTNGR